MQLTAVFSNGFKNKGFTFVEVLVGLVILMISMVAMMEAMVMAMQQNLENYSRDESVRIAEQAINEARNTAFTALADTNYDVTRTYKQHRRTFTVNRTVTALSDNSRAIQLQVSWTVKNKVHTHSVSTVISRGT